MENALWLENEAGIRLGAFMSIFFLMAVWELSAPARKLSLPLSARWRTNLGMALINALVSRLLLPTTAIAVAVLVSENGSGLLNQIALPFWAKCTLAVLLLDLTIYFQHVLFHAVPTLSRLHQVHHADPDFDLTTGIRFHPLEILISIAIKMAAVAVLGAPVLAVLIFEVLLNVTAMFNHGNVSLPPWLEGGVRKVLVTPDMHRIHHSVIEQERNSNYGFCLSIWDRIMGTYRPDNAGGKAALEIGLKSLREPAIVATLQGVLRLPFSKPKGPATE